LAPTIDAVGNSQTYDSLIQDVQNLLRQAGLSPRQEDRDTPGDGDGRRALV